MLLVPAEVEKANVNLVREVLEVDVEVDDVHENRIDVVEVLALVDVLDDVDANRKVAVEVDVEIDLLGVAENRLVDVEMLLVTLALPVLVKV
eukprot:5646245-Amphidinium_carterae.2